MTRLQELVSLAALFGVLLFAAPASAVRFGRAGAAALAYPEDNDWTCLDRPTYTGTIRREICGPTPTSTYITLPIPTEYRSGAQYYTVWAATGVGGTGYSVATTKTKFGTSYDLVQFSPGSLAQNTEYPAIVEVPQDGYITVVVT